MRSGFIAKLAFLLLTASLLQQSATGQYQFRPGLYAGVDLLKSMYALGLVAEPTLRLASAENVILSGTYGYANLSRGSIYYNLDYRNRGHYFKPGLEYKFGKKAFALGVQFLYSSARETGFAILDGPYFGDKRIDVSRRVLTTGFELTGNFYIPVFDRFTLGIFSRIGKVQTHIRSGNFRDMPVFYSPGAGYIMAPKPNEASPTYGISLNLMYRLTGKKTPGPQPDEVQF